MTLAGEITGMLVLLSFSLLKWFRFAGGFVK